MTVEYWRSPAALAHIAPSEWPEGEDFGAWLAGKVTRGALCGVLDFGCGIGRLAQFFDERWYIGYDPSLQMRQAFDAAHPTRMLWGEPPLPQVDAAFAHTVLLHISDAEISETVRQLVRAAPRVLVSEIMGREWRRAGDPPVFNREVSDYCELFSQRGARLAQLWTRPYRRYAQGTRLTVLEFVRP